MPESFWGKSLAQQCLKEDTTHWLALNNKLNTNMKYKLLKDLPWAKAGIILSGFYDNQSTYSVYILNEGIFGFPEATFSDWFEEVDERWKPEDGERYFIVGSRGYVMESEWKGYTMDYARYDIGNCFKTEEQAERAAEQIKALLKEFHKNNP